MKLRMLNPHVLTLTRVLDVTGRRRGPAWPEVPEGGRVLLFLMGPGLDVRGRDGAIGLEEGNFPVFRIGWPWGRDGVSGSMSNWRKALASLSVKYRVFPGGRDPRFRGPN